MCLTTPEQEATARLVKEEFPEKYKKYVEQLQPEYSDRVCHLAFFAVILAAMFLRFIGFY